MNWSEYVLNSNTSTRSETANEEETKVDNISPNTAESLPPLPEESLDRGVLPRVIKTLVQRRREVKKIMKKENNPDKKQEVR